MVKVSYFIHFHTFYYGHLVTIPKFIVG
jgi:hypothetical protein